MDSTIASIFQSMDYPPLAEKQKRVLPAEDENIPMNRNGDPASISAEISRFVKTLEKNRNVIEEEEATSLNISIQRAKTNLNDFINHLYYHLGCYNETHLNTDTEFILIRYTGSVLSAAGPIFAQALFTGCLIILHKYKRGLRQSEVDESCSVSKLLSKLWCEANNRHSARFRVKEHFGVGSASVLEVYIGETNFTKSIANSSGSPSVHLIPLLVLDGADILSVVQILSEQAYVEQDHASWTSSFIVIEESQLEKFKTELQHVKVSQGRDRVPEEQAFDELKSHYELNQSAEIYYLGFDRYVVFGSVPSRHHLSKAFEGKPPGLPLYVIPARSALEAVNKANHYASGYAAAVFTEDGSLSQLVSEKLEVSTIWINTIGQQHPAAPLPYQVVRNMNLDSCVLNVKATTACVSDLLNFGKALNPDGRESVGSKYPEQFTFSSEVADKVKVATGALAGWSSLGGLQRGKILFNLFSSCEERIKLSSQASDLSQCSTFFKQTSVIGASSFANQEPGSAVTKYLRPIGVVALYVRNNETSATDVAKIIHGAIAHGNTCVVVLADDGDYSVVDSLYGGSSALPKGVVNLIRSKDEVHWYSLYRHMEIKSLWLTAVHKNSSLLEGFETNTSIWAGISQYLRKTEETSAISVKTFEPYATNSKYVWRKVNLTYG